MSGRKKQTVEAAKPKSTEDHPFMEMMEGQEDPSGTPGAPRPEWLSDFIGQSELKSRLHVALAATKIRGSVLDHCLLQGPPGLGKTSLAKIVATELNAPFRTAIGPAIVKAGDLASILLTIVPQTVLFIDEIHRLPPSVEEMLYTAMEDFHLDLVVGDGATANTIRMDIQPFTLIGATTRPGALSAPLRDRFGIDLRLEHYAEEDLAEIAEAAARKMGRQIEPDAAEEIARRSRGTPRVALKLLRRIDDYALIAGHQGATGPMARAALDALGVDTEGLVSSDLRYLKTLAEMFRGGPTGVQTIATAIGEDVGTLEDVLEPYLIRKGFIERTPRGRQLAPRGWSRLGLTPPGTPKVAANPTLFDNLPKETTA